MAISGNLADAFIRIRADMKQFFADMRSAKSGVQNALQGIATTAAGIAAAMGINQISQAMQGLVKTMFTANAEIESFAVNFEVFLGSAEKGAAFLAEFRKKFQEFPFAMQDLIGAGGQLLAIGKRGKEVLDIVEAIANATAASGSGRDVFHRISVNMAQMIAQGRIMSADMRQFELALVPAWKILSDEMGISIAKLREMSKEGKLGQSAVDALVRGLMKMSDVVGARSKTAFGMIDILRKRWLLFMEEAGKPLFDGVKAGLQKLIELTGSKGFKEFTAALADGMKRLIAVVKEIAASPFFQKLATFGGLTVIFGTLVGLAIAFKAALAAALPVVLPFVAAGAALAAAFALAAKIVKQSFAGPDGEKFRALLAESRDLVVEIAMNLRDNLLPIVNNIAAAFERTFGPGSDVQKGADSLIGTLLTGLRNVLDWASLLTTNFGLTFAYLKSELSLAFTTIKANALIAFADIFKAIRHGAQDIAVHFYAVAGTIRTLFKDSMAIVTEQMKHPFVQMTIKAIGAVMTIRSAFRDTFIEVQKRIFSIGKALVAMGVLTAVSLAKAAQALSPTERGREAVLENAKKAGKEAESLARKAFEEKKKIEVEAVRGVASIYGRELAKAKKGFDALNKAPGGVDSEAERRRKEGAEAIDAARKERDAALKAIRDAREIKRRERKFGRPPWDDEVKPPGASDDEAGDKKRGIRIPSIEKGRNEFVGLSDLSRRIQSGLGSKSPELEKLGKLVTVGEKSAADLKLLLSVERDMLTVAKKDRVAKAG